MTAQTADPFTMFLMTVNPFEIDGERYRTSGAILHETPGCATDRQRQEHWHTDNQVAKHKHVMAVYEFHEEQRRQHERQLKRAANKANIEYRQRLKARTNTGPYSLAGKGET